MPVHLILFYLTLFLLPTQLGLHTWPNWAFVLGRRIDYLSPTLFLTDIALFLTVLTWVIASKKIHISKKIFMNTICMIVIIEINIFFSISPLVSVYKWIKIIEFIAFGYYIYTTKPSLRQTTLILSIGAAYSSIIGLFQFFLQHSLGGLFWFLGERTFTVMTPGIARINWCWFTTTQCKELVRPYATFSHPNVLAGFLVIILFLIVYNLQTEKIKNLRIWFYGVIAISCMTLMVTFSRSAWVTGILGVILFIFFSKKKFNKKNMMLIFIGIAFCIFISLPYFLTLSAGNESVAIRYSLAISAMQLFFSHPLVGVGLGDFLTILPSVTATRDLFFIQPVHNIFLLWLVETGIMGCIFVGLLLKKYSIFLKLHKTPTLLIIPLILLLFLGLFDHYPLTIEQGQLLLTLCITLPFLYVTNS